MATLVRYEPFREAVSLRDAMNRLFEESFVRPFDASPTQGEGNGSRSLALDIIENEDNLVVEASLPGFKPEEVEISVVDNTLTIKGETKHEEEKEEQGKYLYRERCYGSFRRSVGLPVRVDAAKAEAKFENGVLNLTLPKAEEAKPRRIEVKAK